MSATMMNQNHTRRFWTPQSSNKRKERDGPEALKPPTPAKIAKPGLSGAGLPASPKPSNRPNSNNLLLAGYLAHEFLTKGTLLGQQWDPARDEAAPVSAATPAEFRRPKPISQKQKAEPDVKPESEQVEKYETYVEVADLLKGDGGHLPGIVNPTQLARFLQLR